MSSVSTVTELATVDLAYLEQIRDDWAAQPAVALTLRSAETGCKENENVAFSQYWPGTHEGCSNVGVETVDQFYTRTNNNKHKPVCRPIPSMKSAQLDQFYGQKICATLGGKNFLQVTRPESQNGTCPGFTVPCSTNTSPENTVCYPPAELETSCPITAVKFVVTGTLEYLQYKDDNDWIMQKGLGDYTLFYTKTAADSLPLTRSKITTTPCQHPNEMQTSPNDVFYPLEVQQKEFCSTNPSTNLTFDSRFKAINFTMSAYDLLADSNIWYPLNSLVDYPLYVPNSVSVKQNIRYGFFVRPTIPWSLKCEEGGKTRQSAYESVATTQTTDLEQLNFISFGATLLLAFTIFCGCPVGVSFILPKGGPTLCLTLGFGISMTVIQLVSGYLTWYGASGYQNIVATNIANVNSIAMVNGCSDQYTVVDVAYFDDQASQAKAAMESLIAMGAATLVCILIAGCFQTGIIFIKVKDEDG